MTIELAATGLQSPDDHLVFSQMMEELFVKRLGARLDASARDALRAAGMDIDRKLLPAYPLRVLDAAMEVVAQRVFKEIPLAEAMGKMGAMQVDAFAETLLGGASFQLMKLFSLQRFLDRLTRSWRGANNFIETRVTSPGPGRWNLWVNDVGRFPEVIQGIVQAALDRLGHKTRTEIVRREGLACVYVVQMLDR